MKVKMLGSYRNQKGTLVFVYAVLALSADQKDAYKAAQGDNYREVQAGDNRAAEGTPLWFTTRCIGDSGSLIVTSKGKIVADMSQYEKAASIAAQFGGNLGQELAKHAAAQLLGGSPAEAPATVAAPTVATSADLSNPE